MSPVLYRQATLAKRWGISPRTLERWRWLGQGPAYLKIGGSVAYREDDVLAYEAAQRRVATAETERHLSGPDRFARGIPG
ncbi:helix-turn-helix transcriptional regulator [Roseomonas sp. CCTCC AB2023176]|uniref:helix-turn-helix transcriptional regulator n=1 Tax=Roseomonas sp. CCTCC AB2023176 TaxID=3342640 RepID=UPI0035E15939